MGLMETVHSYYMCFSFIKIIDCIIISRSCPILAVPLVHLNHLIHLRILLLRILLRMHLLRILLILRILLRNHPVLLAQHALQVRVIHPF